MEITYIDNHMAKISNVKDSLIMSIKTNDNIHFDFCSADYSNGHQFYRGNVKRQNGHTRFSIINAPLYSGKNSIYHHTLDMLRGFFISKKYRHSAMNRASKYVQQIHTLKHENILDRKSIDDRNDKIDFLNQQLNND